MNKPLFLLAICIVLVGLFATDVYSAQPQMFTGDVGIEIKLPQIEYLEQNREVHYNFHLYNASNGLPLDNTSVGCLIHLYNETGNHIFTKDVYDITHTWDFEVEIDGGNFSRTGIYSIIFQCNDSVKGGYVSSAVEVTFNGKAPPTDVVKVFFMVVFVALLILVIASLINFIFHLNIAKDLDIKDLGYMFFIYISIFSMKYFNTLYMGDRFIDTIADLFIEVGAFSHVLIPFIIFIVVYVRRSVDNG